MDWIVLAATTLLILAVHGAILRPFAPRVPIGDESDYLARSQWADPHRPVMFLRVPVLPTMFRLAGRISPTPEAGLRLGNAMIGALAAILVYIAGARIGGTITACLAAMTMLLVLERVLLSAHLWPDTPLCALHALALCVLTWPVSSTQAIVLGAIAALATMIRIEQLVLGVGLAAVLIWRDPAHSVSIAIWLTGPSVVALVAWSIVAWRRYGIAMPDTTWLFNLRILDRQLSTPEAGAISVQASIGGVLQADSATPSAPSRVMWLLAQPFALLRSVLRRLAACFGPDTFVSGRLLPPMGQAYPALTERASARLQPWLRWSFPLASTLAAWAMLVRGSAPDYLIAAIPVLGALVVVHFRTRYRLVLMPWLFVAGAESMAALDHSALGLDDAAIGVVLLLLTWFNVRHPPIVEHELQRAPGGRIAAAPEQGND